LPGAALLRRQEWIDWNHDVENTRPGTVDIRATGGGVLGARREEGTVGAIVKRVREGTHLKAMLPPVSVQTASVPGLAFSDVVGAAGYSLVRELATEVKSGPSLVTRSFI
jgi:hypothetical protein